MTTQSENFRPGLAADPAHTLERLLRRAREWAREESLRRRINRERRQLLEMSDVMLADLGISRHEAEAEARRNDVPAERLLLSRQGREA
jgi:uncharacterized protein YjiS (DUF1127 family)